MDICTVINLKREKDFFGRLISEETNMVSSISLIGVPYSGKTEFTKYICRKEVYEKYSKHGRKTLVLVPVDIDGVKNAGNPSAMITEEGFFRNLMKSAESRTGKQIKGDKFDIDSCIHYLEELSREDYLIILVINKFEKLTQNPNLDRYFYSRLRSLTTSANNIGSIGWITTSVKPLGTLLDTSKNLSEFPNIFKYHIYMGLEEEEAVQLLTVLLKDTKYGENEHTARRFVNYFGRVPTVLSIGVDTVLQQSGNDLEKCFEFCKTQGFLDLDQCYEKIWQALDPEEKSILTHIEDKRRLENVSLNKKRNLLISQGLVDLTQNGYKLSGEAFMKWIKDNIEGGPKDKSDSSILVQKAHRPSRSRDKCLNMVHLSDLHMGGGDDSDIFTSLLQDMNTLAIDKLDYLVVSGDITLSASGKEFQSGYDFISKIIDNFGLIPSKQIVVVPGNHDIGWNESDKAYYFMPGNSSGENSIWKMPVRMEADPIGYLYCDMVKAKSKYNNFSKFYEKIYGERYPLDFDMQANVIKDPQNKILFFCLNSCWKMDRYHRDSRVTAEINRKAFSNAFEKMLKENSCGDWLKIVVLHHPVIGKEAVNPDFLEALAAEGFKIIMHGHIHETQYTTRYYNPWISNMHYIGAGTFSAPADHMKPGIPLQYNLVRYYPDLQKIVVCSRKKERRDGAWSSDSRWFVPGRQNRGNMQDSYEFFV